jgi:uncharacterized surface protein with fasciclin (FAS1) repeats
MKKIAICIFLLPLIFLSSCIKDEVLEAGFKDTNKLTIYDFLEQNKEEYSGFIAILEKGGLYKTLSAKNPEAAGYTLFLPNNNAVDEFISGNSRFSSFNDLLNDQEYISALSRYHVLRKGIKSSDFPFGAFAETNLTNDYLTVSFIIEPDTAYFKINNEAAVIRPNIEVSNGFIHVVQNVLSPVVFTSYEWLKQTPGYSIFIDAADITGVRSIIDINLKAPGNEFKLPVTMLVEPDRIYNKYGINSAEELAKIISPNDDNYQNETNPFYNYMAYHVLTNRIFIDDFQGVSSNYNTYSEVPLLINGLGLDIAINKGKVIVDTLISGTDTTLIDYIGIFYDESNVSTQSGAIHFIDNILEQQNPSRSQITFQFREEPYINTVRNTIGTFLLDDVKENLTRLDWTGAELFYIKEGTESNASNDDYLLINGDFSITYTIPKIVQGKYNVLLRAEAFSRRNALVEVFIDGKKIGATTDFSSGGTSASPFREVNIGSINFNRYAEHEIKIRALTPGRFLWDYIRFTPI